MCESQKEGADTSIHVASVKVFDLWYKVNDEQYVIRVGKPRGRHVAGVPEISLIGCNLHIFLVICQVWQPLAPDLVIVTNTGDEGRRVEKLDPEDWMTAI